MNTHTQDIQPSTAFRWSSYTHFENTVRKYVRETLGPEFVVVELIQLCERLWFFEDNIMHLIDAGDYLLPTGIFVNELKRTRTPEKFFYFYNEWKNVLNEEYYERFKVGSPIPPGAFISPKKYISDLIEKYNIESEHPFVRTEQIPPKPGVYFLYNKEKELLYIGKSYCLAQRVYSSAGERKGVCYARIMICDAKVDADIIEPYCIAIYAPPFNNISSGIGKPSFELPLPELSDFINLINIGQ